MRFAGGVLAALGLTLGPAEVFLRACPPADIDPYLGDASTLTGPFAADAELGVRYRDFEAFRLDRDHAATLARFGWPRASATPTWALFGNSFVHASGMLADTLRASVPDRVIFQLGHNEILPVRVAQIETLLDAGLRPEHLVFEMMPIDVVPLCQHSLDDYYISKQGGITHRPEPFAGPLGSWLGQTRLGLVASARAGWQKNAYASCYRQLHDAIHPEVAKDLARLFQRLGQITRRHSVPATVLLIPACDQAIGKASFGFQDDLRPIVEAAGLLVLDPRAEFIKVARPTDLYIPRDYHLTPAGNALLAQEVRRHIAGVAALARQPGKAEAR